MRTLFHHSQVGIGNENKEVTCGGLGNLQRTGAEFKQRLTLGRAGGCRKNAKCNLKEQKSLVFSGRFSLGSARPAARSAEVQLDLFYDDRTNLPLYPAVQAWFRQYQPPTLIVWGKNDFIFPADGAHPYRRDLPDVEFHLLDTGHLALEDKLDEMVPLMRDFLARKVAHA
jgi:pimeloyl-ACP methyl ester carboxylesterase